MKTITIRPPHAHLRPAQRGPSSTFMGPVKRSLCPPCSQVSHVPHPPPLAFALVCSASAVHSGAAATICEHDSSICDGAYSYAVMLMPCVMAFEPACKCVPASRTFSLFFTAFYFKPKDSLRTPPALTRTIPPTTAPTPAPYRTTRWRPSVPGAPHVRAGAIARDPLSPRPSHAMGPRASPAPARWRRAWWRRCAAGAAVWAP